MDEYKNKLNKLSFKYLVIRAINNISIISLIISYFIFFKFFSAINNCSVEFEEIYR